MYIYEAEYGLLTLKTLDITNFPEKVQNRQK